MTTAQSERELGKNLRFLSGGGEMGALTRQLDWSKTPVGPIETWPQSLRTTISIILNSRFPMFLWWGPELICFYNDAYRPSLGENGKHPNILGMPAKEAWPEIWDTINPLIDQVMSGGDSYWSEDQLIPIFRNGKIEDVYWTFSYSPVNDESDTVAGVLVTCNETTAKIKTLAALKTRDKELNFTIDAVDLGIWDLNLVTHKFRGNERLKKWFGAGDENEIELSNALNAIAEEDRENVAEAIARATAKGSDGIYEITYTIENPSDGKQIRVIAKGRTEFDEEGNAIRFSGTLEDITKQSESLKKLQESEKRFRNTVKQAPVGITILRGEECLVEMANQNYLELVDRKESEFVGKPLYESLPEVREAVEPLLQGVLQTGIAFKTEEFPVTLNRFGRQEIAYFNFIYHPLKEDDITTGIMVVVTEVTESVKAKQRVAESEKQFRQMVMQSPIPMTIVRGPHHIIEMANAVMFEQIWHRQENDTIGKSILEVFPELKEQKYEELLNRVYRSGEIHREIESLAYVKGNDGLNKFYLDFEYAPLFETDGRVSGIMITVNNVTEKVEARKAIESNEQRTGALLKTAPFPIGVYIGKDLIIEIANQSIIDIWGKGQDVVGKPFKKLLPEVEGQGVFEQLDQVLETGLPIHTYNKQIRIEDNGVMKHYYFNYSFNPLTDAEGKVYGVMNTAANVTDLNVAKQKIEESEKRFRNVADSAPVLIWMSGLNKECYYFNTAWLKFTGRTMEEESGNGWMDGIFPEDLNRCVDIYSSSFEQKEAFQMEYRLRRNDGEYRWISNSGVPRFTTAGVFEGFIGACMDIHEQIIYQKKLKEDEERLNIVINASELGTWELDLKTNTVNYSERFLEIFGFNRKDTVSHAELVAMVHPDDLEIRAKAFIEAYRTGVFQYISRIIWKDNSIHWVERKGKVFYDDENKPRKLIGTIRDITEEKDYQQKLLEREEKFRLLADSMPQFVWTSGADGNLDYFNQSVYKQTGLTEEQVMNGGWIEIVHPDEREENIKKWQNAVMTGEEFIFEHRFLNKEGEYRWQLSRAIPHRDASGKIKMWVGTSTDIQEQKMFTWQLEQKVEERTRELAQLNEALTTSEQRYHQMVNEVQEYAILYINKDGVIENWNKGAEKIKGYDAEEIIGQNFSVFYTEKDRQINLPQELLEKAKTVGKVVQEGLRRRKDGSTFWANVVISAIHDDAGNVTGFSKVTHDLTERKAADDKIKQNAEQLELKNRELEKMNAELQSFAYISSHDLQEPLRKIQIFAARILEKEYENLSERGKDHFQRMQLSANRMQTLIQDLLTYSRTNVTDRNFVKKDINDIIEEVRADLTELIHEKQARIEVQDLCEVWMIPFQFVQMMHNLIGNALKFSREEINPVIKISCKDVKGQETGIEKLIPEKHYCQIIVEDNGIGFEGQYSDRIFEVFQRLHEKGEYSGTGIGLSIVKKIVENHNGIIVASGIPGSGARFDIFIPYK